MKWFLNFVAVACIAAAFIVGGTAGRISAVGGIVAAAWGVVLVLRHGRRP